jgi:hypothetical protein
VIQFPHGYPSSNLGAGAFYYIFFSGVNEHCERIPGALSNAAVFVLGALFLNSNADVAQSGTALVSNNKKLSF